MPNDLRAKVIRLAHSRPDLRPHLLPLLSSDLRKKEAWLRIPNDFIDFGFRGDAAEPAGNHMATEVKAVVQQLKSHAKGSWKHLGTELMRLKGVDIKPDLSRTAVYSALADTYKDLAEKVEAYFKALP